MYGSKNNMIGGMILNDLMLKCALVVVEHLL